MYKTFVRIVRGTGFRCRVCGINGMNWATYAHHIQTEHGELP